MMANPDSAITRRISPTSQYRRRARHPRWLFPACLFLAILVASLALSLVIDTPMADLPASTLDFVGP